MARTTLILETMMSTSDIQRRVSALEARTAATHRAVAIRRDYEDDVTVLGTNERLSLVDWYARYPDGMLINWVRCDDAA